MPKLPRDELLDEIQDAQEIQEELEWGARDQAELAKLKQQCFGPPAEQDKAEQARTIRLVQEIRDQEDDEERLQRREDERRQDEAELEFWNDHEFDPNPDYR